MDGASRAALRQQIRAVLRAGHYSHLTERAYFGWIRRFVLFNDGKHPAELGAQEGGSFLSQLAMQAKVAPSTQNQALTALLFLSRRVLGVELHSLDAVVRAPKPQRLPPVLTENEVRAVLA